MRLEELELQASKFGREHVLALFTFAAILLVGINLATYPYTPWISVPFYTVFLLGAVLGDALLKNSGSKRGASREWLAFSSFSLTVLVSRAFINTAGLGTPKSSGALGPFTFEQIWFNGIHVHHYLFGFLLLGFTGYAFSRDRLAETRTWILSSIGLGLIADEFGILTLKHTYHSPVSYAAVIAVQAGLFVLLLRHVRENRN
jgi:hypothetical protein